MSGRPTLSPFSSLTTTRHIAQSTHIVMFFTVYSIGHFVSGRPLAFIARSHVLLGARAPALVSCRLVHQCGQAATTMTSELLRSLHFCKNITIALHILPYSTGEAISKHNVLCCLRPPQGINHQSVVNPTPQAVPTQCPLSAHTVPTQCPHSSHW